MVPGLANLLSLEDVDHVPFDSLRLAVCICICQPAAAAFETSGAEIEINWKVASKVAKAMPERSIFEIEKPLMWEMILPT